MVLWKSYGIQLRPRERGNHVTMELKIGLDAITSYRRLAYTPWHAIAEFVDNSTQAYFDNQDELDRTFEDEGSSPWVGVIYDRKDDLLRVSDNSIGMSYEDLERALHVALPPENTSGRSKYGMGLKTAASWIGNRWTIRTKKLGETVEHTVVVDVQNVAKGSGDIPHTQVEGQPEGEHYTILEIRDHNRTFQGKTLSKIKDYLRSMYRMDLRQGILTLEWQGSPLVWEDPELMERKDGTIYKKQFNFSVEGKQVHGWVGILAKGGRAKAGFSIIHAGRVVRGWPDSWRPSSLYGQLQGSNDLINQRLVGEIHLDPFDVSHTKDDILWLGDQEEIVEEQLLMHCQDFRNAARDYRKNEDDERGPAENETQVAIDELRKELESPEAVDAIELDDVPPKNIVEQSIKAMTEKVTAREETFRAEVGSLIIKGYIVSDTSANDPYYAVDATDTAEIPVVVNQAHPHWLQLKGSDGVLNYLRECTYDAIAEWKARQKVGRLDPTTIKVIKDKLLRIPFEVEMHTGDPEVDEFDATA
jgi:hypothetical protein